MGKAKICKYCKSEIDPGVKVCPVCRRPVKKHGCLISVLALVIIFGCAAAFFLQNSFIQLAVSGGATKSELITLEEYNQISTGMTHDKVTEIVGSSGKVSSQVEANGIQVIIVTWYGNGTAGSNANVTFTNGEVTGKAQVGLR